MAKIYHSEIFGLREEKYDWLNKHDINNIEWKELNPNSEFYLFIPQDQRLQVKYQSFPKITDIFLINSVGIVTGRDALTIGFTKDEIWKRVQNFAKLDVELARLTYNLGQDSRDWKVKYAQKDVLESGINRNLIKEILYRPFDIRFTYYTGNSRGFYMTPRNEIMQHLLDENIALLVPKRVETKIPWQNCFCCQRIVEHVTVSLKTSDYLFPLHLSSSNNKKDLFSEHESGEKKPNIKPELFEELEGNYKKAVTPEEIFYYIYAVLYSNTYRTKYSEFLKIDFPRVPFTKEYRLFIQLGKLGKQLADLHLLKSKELDRTISKFPEEGDNKVEKLKYENEKVWINKEQYFDGIEEVVWKYQVGGYQVCEKWLKDRKERTLTLDEIKTYCKIVTALSKTIEFQAKIDELYLKVEES